MNVATCLRTLSILTALTIIVSSATQTSATLMVQEDCAPSLSYKSCLGLMPPAYGLDPHAPAIQADPDAPAITFLKPAKNITTGSWPQVLAAGNFNGDRRADVALATARYFDAANDQRLHLYMAGANASFTRTLSLSAGVSPEALVAQDFNLDGRGDLALALAGASSLAVYSQTTTLSGPRGLSLPSPADALAVGDFSGDLRPDLAAASPINDAIHLFQSSASGLIDNRVSLPYANNGFNALASGDLDNDGDDDLAALRGVGYAKNEAVIYLQGRSAFSTPSTRTPKTGGFLPHSLAVGDVNSDGRDDLVVTAGGNAPNAFLNVFLQQAGVLTTTPGTYRAFHLPSAVAIADISHDGREDVIVVHDGWHTLSVYIQAANHTLSPYAAANLPYSTRYRPHALALADFDGNGGLDVAVVSREAGLTVLTNKLAAPTATITEPTIGATVSASTLTISGTASADAVAVEVRLRGGTEWFPATLNGNTWSVKINAPSGNRAWTIEARAIDADGHVQAPTARTRIWVANHIYLPLISGGAASSMAPDLVGTFTLSPDKRVFTAGEPVQITATITNRGTAKAPPFWVDLYINPRTAPAVPNTRWNDICAMTPCYGIAWSIANELAPGESITLTSTIGGYAAGQSIWPGYFASGTTDLYLYVDSWNPGMALGTAAESDEKNNRAELRGLQVSGPNPPQTFQ
jgi:hypothetical protein